VPTARLIGAKGRTIRLIARDQSAVVALGRGGAGGEPLSLDGTMAGRALMTYRSPMTGKDLLAHFGIAGSVWEPAKSLIGAAGIDLNLTYGSLGVRDPGLLVSRRGRKLVEDCDRILARE